MRCSAEIAVQCSIVKYSAVQCSIVKCSAAVQCSAVNNNTSECSLAGAVRQVAGLGCQCSAGAIGSGATVGVRGLDWVLWVVGGLVIGLYCSG